jgi:hypothetical protein
VNAGRADCDRGKGLQKSVSILETLSDGPVEQAKVKVLAAAAAVAWRTVERAKEVLGVLSRGKGWGPGSVCLWELPMHENDESIVRQPIIWRSMDSSE